MKYLKNNKRRFFALAIGLFILISVFFFQFIYTQATTLESELNHVEGTVRTLTENEKTNDVDYIISITDNDSIISSLNSIVTGVIVYLVVVILFGVYITYYLLKVYKKLKNLNKEDICGCD